jgi:hypothetical protein
LKEGWAQMSIICHDLSNLGLDLEATQHQNFQLKSSRTEVVIKGFPMEQEGERSLSNLQEQCSSDHNAETHTSLLKQRD